MDILYNAFIIFVNIKNLWFNLDLYNDFGKTAEELVTSLEMLNTIYTIIVNHTFSNK